MVDIVIKIPDKFYEIIKLNEYEAYQGCLWDIIRDGIPLPEGHGRLIDAGEYENSIRKHYFDNSTVIRCTEIALDNVPTIIDADKESEG